MTPELTYLLYAVILLIVHVLVQATFSDLFTGFRWALAPQVEGRLGHDPAHRFRSEQMLPGVTGRGSNK